MNLYSPVISGSLTVTGSTSFIGNVTMTGTVSATASNAALLDGTGSVGFTTTGSFTTMSGSVSSRVSQIESVYATTGSNSFRATQSITGSLTVTGQIIAQTLNVQQVTSSILYSSGSNVFGCDLNSRQTFTGSFYQTGSVAVFNSNVGIGTNSPINVLHASSSLPRIIADTSCRYAVFNMYVNGSEKGAMYWDNTDNLLRVQSNQSVALAYGGNSNAYGLYINSSGNTAIKHSNPVDTVDIMGSLRIRCNTSDFTATCNSLVIDYVNVCIFGTSPMARYYSIGCTGISAGHTFTIGPPASPVNAFTINGNGMIGINTDNFGTGTTGAALILRPASTNAGQTAIVLQDYRKCNRWAINGQSGASDATFTIYNAPNSANDYTPAFTIGQNGQVTKPQNAAFFATINTSTNIGVAGAVIQFNCVLYNASGCYNGSTSTFTAPTSGLYQFNFTFLNQNVQNTTGGHAYLSTSSGVGTYYFTRYGCNAGISSTGYGSYVPMHGAIAVYLPTGARACVVAFWDTDGAFSHNSTVWANFSGYLVG
jgi:hypothetical protein